MTSPCEGLCEASLILHSQILLGKEGQVDFVVCCFHLVFKLKDGGLTPILSV